MTIRFLRKIFGYCAVIAVIVFVLFQGFYDYFEAGRTSANLSTFIYDTILLARGNAERSIGDIELILRKLAHFIEYMVLGTVVLLMLVTNVKNRFLAFTLFILLTIPIPFIDEFIIQSMGLGRSSHLLDVLIDLLGIATSLVIGIIYVIVHKWWQNIVD